MSKITISNTVFEHLNGLAKDRYEHTGQQIPDIWAIELDDYFFSKASAEEYGTIITEYLHTLEPFFLDEQRTSYLSVVGIHGMTESVQAYYKLWKTLQRFDFSGFELGAEYPFQLPLSKGTVYGGFAEFDFQNIEKALRLFTPTKRSSTFILNTKDHNLLEYASTKKLLDLAYHSSWKPNALFAYDIFALYDWMKKGDSLIYIAFDGEGYRTSVAVKGRQNNEETLRHVIQKISDIHDPVTTKSNIGS